MGVLACLGMVAPSASAAATPRNVDPPATPERSGRTLIANDGSWALATSYGHAWYRCDGAGAACSAVPGSHARTYLLTTADIGRRIRVLVTAANEVGSASAYSSPTGVIAAAPPVSRAPPTVSGRARIGSRLSSTLGAWSDAGPAGSVSYRRQWQRCRRPGAACENITGATDVSYVVDAADAGRLIRVRVSAEGLGVAAAHSASRGPVRTIGDSSQHAGVFPRLRPFPVVLLAGRLMRGRTHVSRLVVRGPPGASVWVRCRGRGCARRSFRRELGRSRRIRLRPFQRTYRPGAIIEIRVTGQGAIGKFTHIRIRATRPPSRRDACLVPGARRPSRCR